MSITEEASEKKENAEQEAQVPKETELASLQLREQEKDEEIPFAKKFIREFVQVFHIAWPTIISNLCSSFITMTDLSNIGHLNVPVYFAAAGIGNAYSSALSYIVFGLASGLDTLTSQASGAKNHRMVLIVLLRAIFIMTFV